MSDATIHLPLGYALNMITDAFTSGTYVRLGEPGGTRYTPVAIAASASVSIGPFNQPRFYRLSANNAGISYSIAYSGVFSSDDFLDEDDFASNSSAQTASQQSTKAYIDLSHDNTGTAATGVTAVEYGDAYKHTTVLTVSTSFGAIADADRDWETI